MKSSMLLQFGRDLSAAIVGLLLMGSIAQADIQIDNFSVNQSLGAGPGGGAFGPISSTVGGGIGGSRTMTLSGNAAGIQSVGFSVSGGQAALSSGSASTSQGSLNYNGGGGGLGAALAGATAVSVNLASFNAGLGIGDSTISVTIVDGSANSNTQSIILNSGTVAPQNLIFNFIGSGLDFNNIASITVTIDSTNAPGADVVLANLVALTTPVPEPMSIAIWSLLGLTGLILSRRFGLQRR